VPATSLRGRLPADDVFPARTPGHQVRWLDLPGGERARAVVCEPADVGAPEPSLDAPAVVGVHGWGCSAYSFHRILRPIAELGVRAAAPDLRGHGWSSKPLDVHAYTPAALAGWLARVLDALGIRRAVLLGHSLGGHLALEAALAEPARVVGLVLVAPLGLSAVGRLRALRLVTPAALAPLLPYLATRTAVRVGLVSSYGPHRRPTERDVDEYWAPTADPDMARAARLVAHASDWAPGPAERLRDVTCPVRVILGDHDNLIGVDAVRPMVSALPRGTLEVLRGVGHVPIDEAPDRVLAAVAATVAEAAASARATPAA